MVGGKCTVDLASHYCHPCGMAGEGGGWTRQWQSLEWCKHTTRSARFAPPVCLHCADIAATLPPLHPIMPQHCQWWQVSQAVLPNHPTKPYCRYPAYRHHINTIHCYHFEDSNVLSAWRDTGVSCGASVIVHTYTVSTYLEEKEKRKMDSRLC